MGAKHQHGRPPSTALRIALCVTSFVLIVEAVGGWLTGSVALLADAGHMLTDAGALAIALLGAWLGSRPADTRKSFGYGRVEVLAALANGLLLGAVSVAIALESWERLSGAREINALPMIAIACIGLGANAVSAYGLWDAGESLNVRAAWWHVLGDTLGSTAAIAAGIGIYFFGVTRLDPIVGLLISGLLVLAAVRLVREAIHVLLEGTPPGIDLEAIARRVGQLPGVRSVHDLHVWTVTTGQPMMSAHVDLEPDADPETVRESVHRLLHQEYDIDHTTIQTEAYRPPQLIRITPGR